ncbi:TM2 domain-containing protein [Roseovarius sp. E0-M6]|uniref:TM2 domain-containing protein n=1 Tax=Roseovarius sp. E0-M6 TaxID=3127118 RepID=UPI00300FC678
MSLTTEQQMLVEQRLGNERKSVGVAYLLWFFFGLFGVHRFYIGRIASGVIMLLLAVFGFFTLPVYGAGLFILLPVAIWLLVDIFLIPGMIDRDVKARRLVIAQEVNLMTQAANPPDT